MTLSLVNGCVEHRLHTILIPTNKLFGVNLLEEFEIVIGVQAIDPQIFGQLDCLLPSLKELWFQALDFQGSKKALVRIFLSKCRGPVDHPLKSWFQDNWKKYESSKPRHKKRKEKSVIEFSPILCH